MSKKKIDGVTLSILVLLGILAIASVLPFYQVVILSFSNITDVALNKGMLIPKSFDLSAYKFIFLEGTVSRGFFISTIVTVLGTALSIVITIGGAYALSKKDLPGRNIFFNCIIFTMFFSGGLIPYYLIISNLHIKNSILAMILPGAINTFYMILMKNYFRSIPASLEESAKIDGANDITILIKIIIPISMPIIAVILLFYAVDRWNEWWNAMLFISDTKLYPLQLVLREMVTNFSNASLQNSNGSALASVSKKVLADSIKSAVIVISVVPILAIYPFLQKYFATGIMVGSIKE